MNIEIGAEKIAHLFGFAITNSLILSWIVVALLILVAWTVSRGMSLIPKGLQNLAESAVEMLLDTMESIFGSRQKAIKYFPFIATIFIVILISNWIGIFPGVGSVGFWHMSESGARTLVPFLRSPSSDLNFTLALALMTIITINIMAVRAKGIKLSVSRYINFSSPINFFIGILELIGEIAKIISLSFRLFGNVFAGEVLLIITGFLAPYIIPIPFLGLEIFSGLSRLSCFQHLR